jgi:non-ribosomal peptide synthase protein (TIGR01720 family)
VWEVFGALWGGGRVVIGGGDEWVREWGEVRAGRVTLLHLDPAELAAFLASRVKDEAEGVQSLRCIVSSGGRLRQAVVDECKAELGCELHYAYAPPEAGGVVRWEECQGGVAQGEVALGEAMGVSVYVLDEDGQVSPVGVTGEIYVAGEDFGRGYIGDAARTAERSVPDPFAGRSGGRMWRTGDEGRWTSEGKLEVTGCVGRGVWVEGERVDLSEVEAVLLREETVEECHVLWRETGAGVEEGVCYAVVGAGTQVVERMRARACAELPRRLRPAAYVVVERLPLTARGEVDEAELRALEVIDETLMSRWEEAVRGVEGVAEAAVVAQEKEEKEGRLHLSDLLPDWKAIAQHKLQEPAAVPASATDEPTGPQSEAPAIIHGEPIRDDADAPTVLSETLRRAALQTPQKALVYLQPDGSEITQPYAELLEEAERILAGLRDLGLKPQDKVIFQFDLNQNFIGALWGCILGGVIPVPISVPPTYDSANSIVNKLHSAWDMLGQPLVLTSGRLAPQVRSLSGLLGLENFRVESLDELRARDTDRHWHVSQPDDLALLLLTSGSTGLPKAVTHSHRTILSELASMTQLYGLSSRDLSLNWMPLDHVGGIVMIHMKDVYLGCGQVHASTEMVLQNPLKWLDWMEQYRATSTWAPNFSYGLINDQIEAQGQRRWDLSSMGLILNGGEAVVAKTARRFLRHLIPHGLPATAMRPCWGMSETCSGTIFSDRFLLETTTDDDQFVELGRPTPGLSIRIVDDQNQLAQGNVVGRLQVKGRMVTPGYYQNPSLNREAFTEDGWFDTGDLGFLRDGRLTLTGREKDLIIINGVNYYSHEIESLAEEVEGVEVSYVAACAVRDPDSNTDKLAIFFSSPHTDWDILAGLIKDIRGRVLKGAGVNPHYLIPVEREAIPKTNIGKIQRPQLSKRFETGEFDAVLKKLDLLQGNANTLPDWFYQRVWNWKEPANVAEEPPPGCYLVFLDQLGLGAFLCAELERLGRPCVGVEAGADFATLSPNRYSIDPRNPAHYRLLVQTMATDNRQAEQILHLWTYEQYRGEVASTEALRQAQDRGAYSLLFLVQALAQVQGGQRAVQLQVVSSFAQPAQPDDKVAYEKATMAGLLKTIPAELSWMRCRHIDLEAGTAAGDGARVLRELRVHRGEPEVAYRGEERLVPSLEKVDMLQQRAQQVPLKAGGIYLLTGGLGGIGTYVAQRLVKDYQAKLVIVGRTSLPPRDEWPAEVERGTHVAKRIQSYLEIEACGGKLIYQAVDVCDLDSLRQLVDEAETRWQGPLAGIIHMAGEGNLESHWPAMDEHYVAVEAPQRFDDMFRPKVYGTWAVSQLLKRRPKAVFIAFSSVNGLFGGATFSAYSAANSFLDCYTLHQRHSKRAQAVCLNWSMWDDTGMSRGNPGYAREAARGLGYHLITPEQGWFSLIASLSRDPAQIVVGLDGSNRALRRHTKNKAEGVQKLMAYFTGRAESPPMSALQGLVVQDSFETRTACDFVRVKEMPRTAQGDIDRGKLAALGQGARREGLDRDAPRTELERQLVRLWQEVLGVSTVGIHDTFFQLGGDSILAIQVVSRANRAGLQFTPKQLFQHQTIAALAAALAPTEGASGESESADDSLPLTPIQHWLFEQDLPHPQRWNTSVLLEVQPALTPAHLRLAVGQLSASHDALSLRFVQHPTGWRQVSAGPDEVLPFHLIDVSALPEAGQRRAFEVAADRLQTSLDLTRGPLMRATYFDTGAGNPARLLMTANHLVIDDESWRILLDELQTASVQLSRGQAIELPPRTASFKQWTKGLATAARSKELQQESSYWLAEPMTQERPLPLDFVEGTATEESARTLTESLVAEETRALLHEVLQAYNTQIEDVLLTALVQAFARWTGTRSLFIDLERTVRGEAVRGVDISRTVGRLTAQFPILLDAGETSEPGEALKSIKEQLRGVPNRGLGYGLLRYSDGGAGVAEKLRALPRAEVSFEYRGQGPTLPASSPLRVADGFGSTGHDPHRALPYLLTVSASVVDGQLQMTWLYSADRLRPATVERLARDCTAALRALIAHCQSPDAVGYTPSDFAEFDWNQEELNDLLAVINKKIG